MSKNNAGQALQAAKAKIVTLERKVEELTLSGLELGQLIEQQRVLHEQRSRLSSETVRTLSQYHAEAIGEAHRVEAALFERTEQMKLFRLVAVVGGVLTLGYTAAFFFGGM